MAGARIGRWAARAALGVMLLAAVEPATAAGFMGDVNFRPGVKMLDEDDWSPVEDQPGIGIAWNFGKGTWPIHIVLDYLFSTKSERESSDVFGATADVRTEAVIAEVGLGIQKTWEAGRFRPFLAGGGCVVFAQADLDAEGSGLSAHETFNDVAPGGWVGGGFFVRVGPRFNLGLAARWSRAEATFDSVEVSSGGFSADIEEFDVEAGGFHAALVLGVGYPAFK